MFRLFVLLSARVLGLLCCSQQMCAAAGDKEMALKGITIHPLYFSEEFNRTYTVVLIIEAKLLKC